MSEKITTAVICLAKIVSTHYLQLSRNFLTQAEAHQAFYSGDKVYFKSVFPLLWEDIQNTEMYEKYADQLAVLPFMIENDMQWNEKTDVRKGWKIASYNKRKNIKPLAEYDPTDAVQITAPVRDNSASGRSTSTGTRGRQTTPVRSSGRQASRSNRAVRMMNGPSAVVINATALRTQNSRPPAQVLGSSGVRRPYLVS